MGLCLSMLSPFFKWFSTMGHVPLLDYLVRLFRFFRISGIYHDMFFSRCLDLYWSQGLLSLPCLSAITRFAYRRGCMVMFGCLLCVGNVECHHQKRCSL